MALVTRVSSRRCSVVAGSSVYRSLSACTWPKLRHLMITTLVNSPPSARDLHHCHFLPRMLAGHRDRFRARRDREVRSAGWICRQTLLCRPSTMFIDRRWSRLIMSVRPATSCRSPPQTPRRLLSLLASTGASKSGFDVLEAQFTVVCLCRHHYSSIDLNRASNAGRVVSGQRQLGLVTCILISSLRSVANRDEYLRPVAMKVYCGGVAVGGNSDHIGSQNRLLTETHRSGQ